MKVLQVTNARGPFFENQLSALDTARVDYDVAKPSSGTDGDRTVTDYLRFYPEVLARGTSDYDIVHVNYGLLGPFGLAQPTRPVVLTLWGSDVMGTSEVVTGISKQSVEHVDAVVAPSEALRSELDVDAELVPFGIDTDRFRPISRGKAREEIGWSKSDTIALFPYAPDREVKNHPRAEAVIEATDSDVTLETISGVPYEQMPYYLNASDLVLVTSDRESGPMVVKEAAACNVPVVSTDVGFAAEVLEDVENSYVGSTVAELAAGVDAVLVEKHRSNGREVIDVLSIEAMGERLRDVYEQVT